jgi:BirA family biotin operon repressor/biotin-[acetyl-CoA-carboxylase] ligase
MADCPDLAPIATSLLDETGQPISRTELVRYLLVEIEKLYLTLPNGQQILGEWRQRLVTLGKRVRVESGETTLEGIAESVYTDGALLLRQFDGTISRIIAGDVTLRD